MRTVVVASLLIILISLHEQGDATRYLPSIIWDHYNPMLCKCNWFNTNNGCDTLVKVEIYDRFEFVCPTELLNVLLMDKSSRPTDQMNLNLFMRKWKNGSSDLDGLKAAMESGEFCDPDSSETDTLLTCKNGEKGIGKTVRFAKDTGYVKDDLVVFFNNGDDGRESTLKSKEKKCAMAFIVLVTWKEPMKHDMTYGKNLKQLPSESQCKNLNKTCDASSMSTATTTTTTTASIKPTPTPTNTLSTTITTTAEKTTNESQVQPPLSSGRRSNDDWDKFQYGFAVGFVSLLLINIAIAFAYYILCRKRKGQVEDQCQSTTRNDLGTEEDVKSLPKKMLPKNEGNNNQAYQSYTLPRADGITI